MPLTARSSHSAHGTKRSNELKGEDGISIEKAISSAIRHWLLESTSLPSMDKAYCHSEKLLGWLRGFTSHAETLKNVSSPEAQAARQAALDTLKRISDL